MSTAVGVHQITVTATNSQDTVTEIFDITIEAELIAPQITAISDISVAYNTAITATAVTVTGNPTPTVTVTNLPTGLTYTGGEITGTSTDTGTHEITVTATNSQGDDTVTFDITIEAELTVPAITAIGDISFVYNANITAIDVTITGNPTPSVTVSGLPTGLTYDSTNTEITGMSTAVGAHEITIIATNSQGTDIATFNITIAEQLIAPAITAISDISVAYNVAISATAVTVTGNPTPTITVAGLPTGITYSSADAEITGMSTTAGTHQITITATNSEGSDTVTFNITIAEQPMSALTFNTITRQDISSGSEQTFGLSSFINQGNPVTNDFSIEIPVLSGFPLNSANRFPRGCTIVGDEIHILDGDDIYAYELDGTYIETHTLDSDNQRSFGITYNASANEVYVADFTDAFIYVYDPSYELERRFALNTGNSQPEGLVFYDDLIWCVDRDKTVYPYSSQGVFDNTRGFTLPSGGGTLKSINRAAGRFWIGESRRIFAVRDDGTLDDDLEITVTPGHQGLGIFNNQFLEANTATDTVTVDDILSGVTISINDSTQVVTVDSDEAWADHEIAVTVTAHQANFTDPTAEFMIRLEQHIPVWTALSDVTWTADSAITDIDLNSMVAHEDSIALQSGTLPAGVTLSDGVLSGTPTDPSDDTTLTFRATNDAGTADATLAVTINGVVPSWTSLASVTWTEDTAITSIDLRDSVTGNPTPTIALLNSTLPDGVTLSNGVVSGTPTNPDQDRTVTFRATNSAGRADTTLSITIDSAETVPVWTALQSVTWTEGVAIRDIDLNDSVTGLPTPSIALQNSTLPSGDYA